MKNPWDIFDSIIVTKLKVPTGDCHDCDFANGVDTTATHSVLFYFRGDEYAEHNPYGAPINSQYLGLCDDHVGYWRKLEQIHKESSHVTN